MTDPPDPLDDLAIGYVLPTEQETAAIWDRAIIAVDTNVLLNLYRYSPEAREELFSALEAISDRLFIPHRVADEYMRRRISVLIEQTNAQSKMRSAIDKATESFVAAVRKTYEGVSRRDGLQHLETTLRSKLEPIRDEVLKAEEERLPAGGARRDAIHDRVVSSIRGRVGAAYDDARTAEIEAMKVERFEARQPPGYMDVEKDDGGIGDLIVWNQLLDKAELVGSPIVFVTDDTKEDWVWEEHDSRVGPRPELVREMHARAGVEFLLYTTARFLSIVGERREIEVSPAVLEEAEARERAGASRPVLIGVITEKSGFRTEIRVTDDRAVMTASSAAEAGLIVCSVASPRGTQFLWTHQLKPGEPAEVVFPDGFLAMGLVSGSEPAVGQVSDERHTYVATWTFSVADEATSRHHENAFDLPQLL